MDVNKQKHLDTLKEIIKELEAKKKHTDYTLLVLKKEYDEKLKELQDKNLKRWKQ
jgi:hypothetical protein